MRTVFVFGLIASIFGGVLPSVAQAARGQPNAFSEGTTKIRLSEAEKASLLEYANNSKTKLEKALEKAKGKSFAEANAIYLKTIKQVVVSSFEQKPRSELLLRYALNQALELTFGVPSADGSGIESEGVLQGIGNRDLLTVILEDSIKLALTYYEDDRVAIEKGTLTDLPYMKQAVERLGLTRSWLMSVNEPTFMYALSVAALQHFMNTAANVDQAHRALYAEELTQVDELLQSYSPAVPRDSKELMRAVRVLRGEIRKLEESAAGKMKLVPVANRVTPSQAGLPGSSSNSFGMSFVSIKPGLFIMGSPNSEPNRRDNEGPQHAIQITRDFEIQKTEVTQRQYFEVMKDVSTVDPTPSRFSYREHCPGTYTELRTKERTDSICPENPVENISFDDVQKFIVQLNQKARDGYRYRLPTEAEWEYVARAGTITAYVFGNDPSELSKFAWYESNSGEQTHQVCDPRIQTNPWGICDIYGNVWEWLQDFNDYFDSTSSFTNPTGPSEGQWGRACRGGSWESKAWNLRSSFRGGIHENTRSNDLGFRLVRERK